MSSPFECTVVCSVSIVAVNGRNLELLMAALHLLKQYRSSLLHHPLFLAVAFLRKLVMLGHMDQAGSRRRVFAGAVRRSQLADFPARQLQPRGRLMLGPSRQLAQCSDMSGVG